MRSYQLNICFQLISLLHLDTFGMNCKHVQVRVYSWARATHFKQFAKVRTYVRICVYIYYFSSFLHLYLSKTHLGICTFAFINIYTGLIWTPLGRHKRAENFINGGKMSAYVTDAYNQLCEAKLCVLSAEDTPNTLNAKPFISGYYASYSPFCNAVSM